MSHHAWLKTGPDMMGAGHKVRLSDLLAYHREVRADVANLPRSEWLARRQRERRDFLAATTTLLKTWYSARKIESILYRKAPFDSFIARRP